MLVADRVAVCSVEGRETKQGLVHHDAEPVDVASTVEEFSARLLGRHVVRSSHDISASGHAAAEMPCGNSEISNECVLVFIKENVVRLDVAVHQSTSVGVIESCRDLRRDAGRGFRRKRAMAANAITQ